MKELKATITLAGKPHEIYISQEWTKQIKRLQKLIKGEHAKKEE